MLKFPVLIQITVTKMEKNLNDQLQGKKLIVGGSSSQKKNIEQDFVKKKDWITCGPQKKLMNNE